MKFDASAISVVSILNPARDFANLAALHHDVN